ncbi:hypothetical protein [Pollutibacter soli]
MKIIITIIREIRRGNKSYVIIFKMADYSGMPGKKNPAILVAGSFL